MTDHRPAARAAIRGLIQLLTDRSPRRQPRDFITDASPPPPPYSAKGDCPDWLAVALGAMAVCALYALVVYAWWSL